MSSRATWTGPFRIGDLLDRCLEPEQAWPPDDCGVYLVSRRGWVSEPSPDCRALYFGGNAGPAGRFRTRVGDLIADLFGFYGERSGHHSGGQSLWKWCDALRVKPSKLYLGWATGPHVCGRCLEVEVAAQMTDGTFAFEAYGLLNRRRPPRCCAHAVPERNGPRGSAMHAALSRAYPSEDHAGCAFRPISERELQNARRRLRERGIPIPRPISGGSKQSEAASAAQPGIKRRHK